MNKELTCPCGSLNSFSVCCSPYITGFAVPESPETLMRSRYSAYATGHFQYVANTYASNEQSRSLKSINANSQPTVSAAEIEESSLHTKWCKLEVVSTHEQANYGEVEFIAYYQLHNQFYAMHERSRFIKTQNQWLYVDGKMLEKTAALKLGRNDSCLCGSGKKFKRCCQG